MIVHTLNQTIQAGYLIILIKNDNVPALPSSITLTKEPALHESIAVHPQVTRCFEFPVFPIIGMKLVIIGIALLLE